MQIGISTSCFLEKHEGYIVQRKIPDSIVGTYDLELQIDRGFTFDDFPDARVRSLHLPFARFIPAMRGGKKVFLEGRTINIASIDEKKWIRDLKYCRDVIKLSLGKGIENAILHYGNCTCGEEAYKNPHHQELHWTMESKFLKEIAKDVKRAGIKLLIENHPYQDRIFKNHATHIQRIIDEKVASLCLDFPHAFIRNKKFGDEEPIKMIEKFQSNILEVHLADNNGETNEPLILGAGKMPWQKLIDALDVNRKDIRTVMELHSDPMTSLEQLQTHMKDNNSERRKGIS